MSYISFYCNTGHHFACHESGCACSCHPPKSACRFRPLAAIWGKLRPT